jgi:hypothetical protein
MLTFDRIVLTMLALGIWALVLTPQELGAHHQDDDGHSCHISGSAFGVTDGTYPEIYQWGSVIVDCTHY